MKGSARESKIRFPSSRVAEGKWRLPSDRQGAPLAMTDTKFLILHNV